MVLSPWNRAMGSGPPAQIYLRPSLIIEDLDYPAGRMSFQELDPCLDYPSDSSYTLTFNKYKYTYIFTINIQQYTFKCLSNGRNRSICLKMGFLRKQNTGSKLISNRTTTGLGLRGLAQASLLIRWVAFGIQGSCRTQIRNRTSNSHKDWTQSSDVAH